MPPQARQRRDFSPRCRTKRRALRTPFIFARYSASAEPLPLRAAESARKGAQVNDDTYMIGRLYHAEVICRRYCARRAAP